MDELVDTRKNDRKKCEQNSVRCDLTYRAVQLLIDKYLYIIMKISEKKRVYTTIEIVKREKVREIMGEKVRKIMREKVRQIMRENWKKV